MLHGYLKGVFGKAKKTKKKRSFKLKMGLYAKFCSDAVLINRLLTMG